MASEKLTPPHVDGASELEPFSSKERLGAALVGTLLSAAGAVSVFLTDNQAGCVALIVVGAAFLLTAVNGSPLTKAKFKDYEVEAGRRRSAAVAQAIAAVAPEDGRQVLEALQVVDPRASRDPAVAEANGLVYERLVGERILALAGEANVRESGRFGPDYGVDFMVNAGPTGGVAVECRYVKGGRKLTILDIERLAGKAVLNPRLTALLVVTSGQLSSEAQRSLPEIESRVGKPIRVVRWTDEQDDAALRIALTELSASWPYFTAPAF